MYLLCFQHIRPQILASFSHPNPLKNTLQNRHCKRVTTNLTKTTRLIKIDSQEGPKIHQKSMKIQPWTPRCPLWCPCGPMDHQHGDPRAKSKLPKYQNGPSRSPKLHFRIKQNIHVSNQPVSSYLFEGGPAAGAKP